jgi:hypothetical protein
VSGVLVEVNSSVDIASQASKRIADSYIGSSASTSSDFDGGIVKMRLPRQNNSQPLIWILNLFPISRITGNDLPCNES